MALALTMVQNKTADFFLTVTQSDGVTAQDLTGTTLYFHAANGAGFTIDKNSGGAGITVTNAAGGLATLRIDPADTAALVIASTGVLQMPCELTLKSGTLAYEIANGTMTITANVGTP